MGTADGFVVTAQVFPAYNDDNSFDYSSARIQFIARRTRVHQGFAIMIFIGLSLYSPSLSERILTRRPTVMWTLTLLLSYITLWTWKGGKRVEMGIISMNSALLLAIPRVRDAQPGIPKLGICQDSELVLSDYLTITDVVISVWVLLERSHNHPIVRLFQPIVVQDAQPLPSLFSLQLNYVLRKERKKEYVSFHTVLTFGVDHSLPVSASRVKMGLRCSKLWKRYLTWVMNPHYRCSSLCIQTSLCNTAIVFVS